MKKLQDLKIIDITYEKNGIRIQLKPAGEKNAGNEPLLRVFAFQKNNKGWEFIENFSYCTRLTVFHEKSVIQKYIEMTHKKMEKILASHY